MYNDLNKHCENSTEASIYRKINLSYIPPELREDRGEIKAALKDQLPDLVNLQNIRGVLHCHTHATDGFNTIEEIARSAREHGYEYIAITDHSKHLTITNGLDEKRLLQQIKK